ncbi:MAG: hypothetical protein MHPSP_001086, partial [Paramarteilia canceri]
SCFQPIQWHTNLDTALKKEIESIQEFFSVKEQTNSDLKQSSNSVNKLKKLKIAVNNERIFEQGLSLSNDLYLYKFDAISCLKEENIEWAIVLPYFAECIPICALKNTEKYRIKIKFKETLKDIDFDKVCKFNRFLVNEMFSKQICFNEKLNFFGYIVLIDVNNNILYKEMDCIANW